MSDAADLPLIDIGPLLEGSGECQRRHEVGAGIDRACRSHGFFRIVGHGVGQELFGTLEAHARDFFGRSDEEKAEVAMARAGPAWRGWFPVGGELTSGRPDLKEGLYFGLEHGPDHPRVLAGTPLHGPNLFPTDPPELGPVVLAWLDAVTPVAHAVMRGIALGLGLPETWFEQNLTTDPTILFRIFHYPPASAPSDPGADPKARPVEADEPEWGVAEHTDYGLLTILAQDDRGGLEVSTPRGWIDVPAEPGVLVCNIGDMLDRLTEGRYRSTPHRVRSNRGRGRLSFPFFLDPSWDALVTPLPVASDGVTSDGVTSDEVTSDGGTSDGVTSDGGPSPGVSPSDPAEDVSRRRDKASVRSWEGTYGEYLTAKVAKVFPELFAAVSECS